MEKKKKSLIPVAWLFYLIIMFEVIYMISPFAFYYYSAYGPVLNFLNNHPQTAWLCSFFLPHFTDSTSLILNSLMSIGMTFFVVGLVIFITGAGQIYYAKFTKKGAVTGGLYRFIRHPQYTAFSLMGFGLLLIMPRFIVLIMLVTMFFVYYFLAMKEENECREKFDKDFEDYVKKTSMFVPLRINPPVKLPVLPESGFKRVLAILVLYGIVLTLSITVGYGLRNYSLSSISVLFNKDLATISTALKSKTDIEKILEISLRNPEVLEKLEQDGYGKGEKFLNYIVPLNWFFGDLPLEERPEWATDGHYKPKRFNKALYKVLFTKAILSTDQNVYGLDIVKKTVARIPVLVVKLDTITEEIIAIEKPILYSQYGNIPIPLF